ncbi:endo-1,3;1,4-beta-D-glucanase-like isoform X2 [Andrographis paniculata]|uniref:endo-1,3;1,4-beta-D-glucanase-like isoform X2 n=1 Tax=Andrographis paniculata TaxID=175694 RepID=UPI0021E9647D|nr:endo-1,3;1,4-beta-D-glucanase-like isoform X2 [Andrographis paniculata]
MAATARTQQQLLFFIALCIGASLGGIRSAAKELEERGEEERIGGLESYVRKSGFRPNSRVVILISDVFGFERPHLRMIADKVAAAGFYPVVPDFFDGDAYTSDQNMTKWYKNHKTDGKYKDVKTIIDSLERKGVTKFGVAGFCWGGKVAIEVLNKDSRVDTGVLLHPSFVNHTDIEKVNSPIAILGGGKDNLTTPATIKEFDKILETKPNVDSYVKIFPKAEHGWTLGYNETDKRAVRRAEKAHKIMLKWFAKHLK